MVKFRRTRLEGLICSSFRHLTELLPPVRRAEIKYMLKASVENLTTGSPAMDYPAKARALLTHGKSQMGNSPYQNNPFNTLFYDIIVPYVWELIEHYSFDIESTASLEGIINRGHLESIIDAIAHPYIIIDEHGRTVWALTNNSAFWYISPIKRGERLGGIKQVVADSRASSSAHTAIKGIDSNSIEIEMLTSAIMEQIVDEHKNGLGNEPPYLLVVYGVDKDGKKTLPIVKQFIKEFRNCYNKDTPLHIVGVDISDPTLNGWEASLSEGLKNENCVKISTLNALWEDVQANGFNDLYRDDHGNIQVNLPDKGISYNPHQTLPPHTVVICNGNSAHNTRDNFHEILGWFPPSAGVLLTSWLSPEGTDKALQNGAAHLDLHEGHPIKAYLERTGPSYSVNEIRNMAKALFDAMFINGNEVRESIILDPKRTMVLHQYHWIGPSKTLSKFSRMGRWLAALLYAYDPMRFGDTYTMQVPAAIPHFSSGEIPIKWSYGPLAVRQDGVSIAPVSSDHYTPSLLEQWYNLGSIDHKCRRTWTQNDVGAQEDAPPRVAITYFSNLREVKSGLSGLLRLLRIKSYAPRFRQPRLIKKPKFP